MQIEFIPATWLELAAWTPGMLVYSRTISVEAKRIPRRTNIEQLLKTLLPTTSNG